MILERFGFQQMEFRVLLSEAYVDDVNTNFKLSIVHFSFKNVCTCFPYQLENLENGRAFSSQGKGRDFLADWESQ